MRRIIVATTLAAIAAVSCATVSVADSRQRYNDYYYKSYDNAYEPVCVFRKVRSTDDDGNRIIKKIRICR